MTSGKIKLICIPFSGGNCYSYAAFKNYLPNHIELFTLELPGHGKRIGEKLLSGIEEMTEDLFCQSEHLLDGPYIIFGHSLGALLAITLGRTIRQRKRRLPAGIFVSGQIAPSRIQPDDRYLYSDEKFIQLLREMEGTPAELLDDRSFIYFYLPIIRKDFEAVARYEPETASDPFDLPITVLVGDRENLPENDVACWQSESTVPINIHRFPGNHFFIFKHVKEICQLIAATDVQTPPPIK